MDEHLKARYGLEPGMSVNDYHQDLNILSKLMEQYRPRKFCYFHTSESLSRIKDHTREWYAKNKKKRRLKKK